MVGTDSHMSFDSAVGRRRVLQINFGLGIRLFRYPFVFTSAEIIKQLMSDERIDFCISNDMKNLSRNAESCD